MNNIFTLTFLSNKYTKYYFNIINNALQENRKKLRKNNKDFVYYESHHIIPKSIRPEFKDLKLNPWNKILLTPKEHFICHLLLTKMLTGSDKNKMVYALWSMTNRSNKHQIRFHSKLYSFYKTKMQNSMSSDRKGKTFIELYGEERASEIKQNMLSRKSRSSPLDEELIEISNRIKNAYANNPWTIGFQISQPPKRHCDNCHLDVDLGNYTRHHGNKCTRQLIICPVCQTSFYTTLWENKKFCSKKCSMQGRRKDASADLT